MTAGKRPIQDVSTSPPEDVLEAALDKYFAKFVDTGDTVQQRPGLASAGKLAAIAFVAALDAADPRRLGTKRDQNFDPLASMRVVSSATDNYATARELRERIAQVLARAADEEFREGMPSEFAANLHNLVLDFGTDVVRELQRGISARAVRPGLGFEALTILADFEYSSIAADRLKLV